MKLLSATAVTVASTMRTSSPESTSASLCYIPPSKTALEERRGFLFCQEDRAILCRECDIPIHKANEHTQKHNRFLLTGVKLSASSSSYPASFFSSDGYCNVAVESDSKSTQTSIKNPNSVSSESPYKSSFHMPSTNSGDDIHISDAVSISTSSISEYLMETLPGWHVEDFLDPSSAPPPGFCKDFEGNGSYFSPEDSIWAPQASPISPKVPLFLPEKGLVRELQETKNAKVGEKWSDYGLTVPQISSPPSIKRSRHKW